VGEGGRWIHHNGSLMETVQIPPKESSGPEGHDEAMVAKVDAKEAELAAQLPQGESTEAEQENPAWLPEKFKSPEDLVKAYQELERKQSAPKETPPVDLSIQEASAELESKGLDLNDFSKEFAQSGSLSAESYERLQKAGYPKDFVDQYISGQQALATQAQQEVFKVVGGEQNFKSMVEWATSNMSAEEISAYNSVIDSGNTGQIRLAVAGVHARYEAARGKEPSLLQGEGRAAAGEAYESTAQLTAAMRDPRYQTDPAYRKQVENKLSRSRIF
jgi:hypothetical protein